MKNKNIRSFEIKLLCVRILMWGILSFERVWVRLLPFFLVLSLFCSFSWLGLFGVLGYWSHWLLLGVLLVCTGASLFFLIGFRFPTMREVDHRLERVNNLKHKPLNVQKDHICSEIEEGFSTVIWREHQRRMAKQLYHLKTGFISLNSAAYDPLALRALCVLLFVCAFSFSFGSRGGRLADAFDFRPVIDEKFMRIDAWITPPAYTGVAPIYLTKDEKTQLEIPEGSDVVVRVVNGAGVKVKAKNVENGQKVLFSEKMEQTAFNDPIVHFETHLEHSMDLFISSRRKKQQWHLQVMKDKQPTIDWLEKPGRILTGSLELQYVLDDDYGVTKAFVEIEPLFQHKNAPSLYQAPEIKLLLPRGGKGKMRTVHDVSAHPWAGSQVKITLVAEDGAGQKGRSKTFVMILPQRVFSNPVARAVSELRRLLALDTAARERVLDMLSALLVRPEKGLQNVTHFLVLQSAWTRLSLAQTEEDLRGVVDYLWQIALGLEGNQLESAQKNLKQAQAALRDALRYGAPPAEIERLMADLRQAMDAYIQALAEKEPDSQVSKNSKNFKSSKRPNLSEDTLQEKLNLIEEMAKMGSSLAAEQLLAEIEQTLDHLHVQKGNKNEGEKSQSAQMKEKMDKLGDLMRRQQEILNETHQLEMKQKRGENVLEKQKKSLKKRQAELQSELSTLEKELSEQGFETGGALKKAEEKMNSAEDALDHENHQASIQNQSDALESLRQGAQSVLKKMRETLKETGNAQNADSGPKDPLGRPLSSQTDKGQEGEALPQESDQMRTRQILDEIRKRLGKEHLPEVEKNYLERLLHFN
ncbi:TIGR02302 family protein [Bartonella krasnovii]|uniref:TIGR02302 family protein n=1 Tax=Bartonella krasnovii TaxID=2267275 RepID=A0ABY3VZB2_9HYPH|nr:TIGR02302 family protein [Bartonella krasnovii]UNF29062.1 TIGR02302 family protein [Bartonella krasnovii]UNF35419.1 TIGR02302 family protein [Bartonella krasnovii]UNF37033.1 TIGR02302 family protein [Bartonella krasnovii]UNF46966.1 TIGR02302 family protein [Bartonella krasnovii]UNF48605.1 TIGR02302 family protein [Bartonella krasnovii]